MTESLITELAQSGGPRVISRTSVVQYKDSKKSLSEIARELNVDGIVEGAVVRSGSRVRITAKVIHARTERHLWARSYERDANDLVGLQQELTQAITRAVVGTVVTPTGGRAAELRPVNAQAYRLFYQGLVAASAQNYEGFRDAITFCQKAIEKQPDFASAYARMALNYFQFAFVGPMSPKQFMPHGEAAARKAVELDERLAEGHAVLGIALSRFRWDWSGSEREFRRALALDPNYAEGHRMFSALLLATGRVQEALSEALRARELDPLALQTAMNLGLAYRAAGQYDRAITEFRKALEKHPNRPRAHSELGITYVLSGMLSEGVAELETAVRLMRDNTRFLGYLAYAYAVSGRRTEARKILEELQGIASRQYVSPTVIARIYTGLDNRQAALAWLEKAYRERDGDLVMLASDMQLAVLRSDPHYREILARMGLSLGARP